METSKNYYFLIDYKASKKAVKAHIDNYNDALCKSYTDNQIAFRKTHKLSPKQTYKAVTIKSGEEKTFLACLEIYGGSLHQNSFTKVEPDAFYVNNVGIATNLNKHVSERTIQRHFVKLKQAGLIVNKIFRGTNASSILIFNSELIHFKKNASFNWALYEQYKAAIGHLNPPKAVYATTLSFSAKLSDFPLGYTPTNCRLNSTSILLQVHKINIESGLVNYDFPFPQSFSENHVNKNFFNDFNENKERKKSCQTLENTPPVAAAPPRQNNETNKVSSEWDDFVVYDGNGNRVTDIQASLDEHYNALILVENAEKNTKNVTSGKTEEDKLWKHIFSFYCFAMSVLWPNRIVSNYERAQICSQIYIHFKNRLKNSSVDAGVIMFRGEFMFRVMLTKKYLDKNKFWNLESPISYFNINHKAGFNGTLPWVDKTKKMEAENKVYLSHYKIFIQAWKDYTKNPNVTVYRQVQQQLGKLKKDCWLNYFNQSVANLNSFNENDIQNIWKTHYRA